MLYAQLLPHLKLLLLEFYFSFEWRLQHVCFDREKIFMSVITYIIIYFNEHKTFLHSRWNGAEIIA